MSSLNFRTELFSFCMQHAKQTNGACSAATAVVIQAELLQQEIINRLRLSIAAERLLDDLPKQAQAAEDRMFMAEYVRGYQLVSFPPFLLCHAIHQSGPTTLCFNDSHVYILMYMRDAHDSLPLAFPMCKLGTTILDIDKCLACFTMHTHA